MAVVLSLAMHVLPPQVPRKRRHTALPLTTRFGDHDAVIRFLCPADAQRLLDFFASHTLETILARYGYACGQMSHDRAAELVGVDQTRDAALGVFERHNGQEVLIAVGRYCLDRIGRSAETAFVVHEARRHLGIATTLLRILLAIARERGLKRLTAQVQQDNAAMLSIFRRLGGRCSALVGSGCVAVEIQLGGGSTSQSALAHPIRRSTHEDIAAQDYRRGGRDSRRAVAGRFGG